MNSIKSWFQDHFSNPQVFTLALLLVVFFAVVTFMGQMLTPVLAAVVIAYLLEGLVARLCRIGMPRLPAVLIVFIAFLIFVGFVGIGLLPLISRQATQLIGEIPSMIEQFQGHLMRLPELYPALFSPDQVQELIELLRLELTKLGRKIVSVSVSSVVGLITFIVYAILLPLLVFFFMKDKQRILSWAPSGMVGDIHYLRYPRAQLQHAVVVAGWRIRAGAVHRRRRRNLPSCLSCVSPVGSHIRLWLVVRRVSCGPSLGRQRACAAAVLRSRESSPGGHYHRSSRVWWFVGLLGGVLRDPTSNSSAGGPDRMANRLEAACRGCDLVAEAIKTKASGARRHP